MKKINIDKTFSKTLLMISGIIFFYGIVSSNFFEPFLGWNFKQIIFYTISNYFDFLIILYIFICFQFAGYFELKYNQDYLICSVMSIILTPFSLLLLKNNEKN